MVVAGRLSPRVVDLLDGSLHGVLGQRGFAGPAAMSASALARPRWLLGALVGIAVSVFVLVKATIAIPSQADENVYAYAAHLLVRGEHAYADFFFAHPPVHLYLLGAIHTLGVSELVASRVLALLAALTVLAGIARTLRREVGSFAAVAAAMVCMFSYGFLHHTTYGHGIGVATALVTVAMVALRARPRLAGVLLALAVLTRFVVVPAVASVLLVCLAEDRRLGRRAILMTSAVVAATTAASVLLWGERFWQPVVVYHVLKPALSGSPLWRHLVDESYLLVALAGLGVVGPWLRVTVGASGAGTSVLAAGRAGWSNATWSWRVAALSLLTTAIAFAAVASTFPYYLTAVFPWLAVLASHGIATVVTVARQARGRPVLGRWLVVGAAAILALLWFGRPVSPVGRRHVWHDHRLGAAGAMVGSALFPSVEHPNRAYNPLTRLLWNSQRHAFVELRELADWVATHTRARETFIADPMQAPLIALCAQRRIAAGAVDLNRQRFSAGLPAFSAFLARARDDQLRYVIVHPDPERGDLYSFPQLRELLAREFTLERSVGAFAVFRRL